MIAAVFAKPGVKIIEKPLSDLLSCFEKVFVCEDFNGKLIASSVKNAEFFASFGFCNDYKKTLCSDVETALSKKIDVIVSVGGDGLASYITCFVNSLLKDCEKHPKLLGWGAGTANVGPIVSTNCSSRLEDYSEYSFDALEVWDGDQSLGYAFNDLIIGSSFLGTVEGKTVNLCAKSMALEGKTVVCDPNPDILKKDYKVYLNGKLQQKIPFEVQQICASTVDQSLLYGRAVYGGLMQVCGMNSPASVAFTDRIAVDSRPWTWSYKGVVNTAHICFEDKDLIEIEGLTDNGQIIIDGNPFVRKAEKIGIKVVPHAVSALRSDL